MDENKDIIEEINIEDTADDTGKVDISDEVIATIAGIATAEIEGVADMCGGVVGGIAEMLGAKKNLQKGVKVEITPEGATIELYIIVDYGIRIPELAWEVQENVKNSVETMTGINILKINVHVEGVRFEKAPKPEKEPKKKKEKAPKKGKNEEIPEEQEAAPENDDIIDEIEIETECEE